MTFWRGNDFFEGKTGSVGALFVHVFIDVRFELIIQAKKKKLSIKGDQETQGAARMISSHLI